MTRQASEIVTNKSPKTHEAYPGKEPIAFEDSTLVAQAKDGDMRAYGALVAKYQHRIYNLVYRMCGRAADAEELSQEAFLKALERLHQFRGNSKFYTWLFRIAANLTISHRRRAGRVKFHSMTGPEEYNEAQSVALTADTAEKRNPAPEAHVMTAELNGQIMAALEELDDEFRMVVVLRDIEELDYAAMADILDVPIGTIKSRLHRARSILRDKLADYIR